MGGASGGLRATRALLLLLMLALALVDYHLYTLANNATQSTIRNDGKSSINWPKPSFANTNHVTKAHANNNIVLITNVSQNETENRLEIQKKRTVNVTDQTEQSVQDNPAYSGTPSFNTKITNGLKNQVTTEGVRKSEPTLPLCPKLPPDLGPISVNKTELELDFVEKKFPEIHFGGRYSPPNCTARHKVAIIVPYRNRRQHLAIFLNHMHPFLMKQQIEYRIFIVEQEGNKDFNRAKLMNVGFVESQRLDSRWQCFVFHDIDLLPLDTRNLYTCPRQPRHMSVGVERWWWLWYEGIFGGVSALTLEQFTKVNGFSNKYWGWGGEDDDLVNRLKEMNYHISRYKVSIAQYAMLDHKGSVPNPKRYQLLSQTNKIFQKDGLSTLEYSLVKVTHYHLYTHILVNIDSSVDEDSWWMNFAKLFGDDRYR